MTLYLRMPVSAFSGALATSPLLLPCAPGGYPVTRRILALVFLLLPGALRAEETLGYYRFPAIHGDTIVFAAEGDLWRVDRRGGVATRLTTHPAEESRPAISPDGKTLAFSAAYEGPTEVYTMPIDEVADPLDEGRLDVP